MRKKIINMIQQQPTDSEQTWLDLENKVTVELSSEDTLYPIESALLATQGSGWRAAEPGKQTIRLLFDHPQRIEKIKLCFVELEIERTQEYLLRWCSEKNSSFQEIVRQQWNFNPEDANTEMEQHQVELQDVMMLELIIIPNISGGDAFASLKQFQLA